MEAKYKSLSVFEFQQRFPDDRSCHAHLAKLKWEAGYKCKKCGNGKYCNGNQEYDRQCTSCHYVESATAGTLFHKVKFPVLKAFWIIYFVSTNKKGIASTELSRKLELRQKTCWLFKQKVMKAMESSGRYPLTGMVEADEFVVGQQEEGTTGRENKKKKLVAIAIERHGKSGASRMYARHIDNASFQQLGPFIGQTVDRGARLRTDCWPGYTGLKDSYENFCQVPSGPKGSNFKTLHRVIMGFKAWLRGMHSRVVHIQAYLNEYCYRYNRSFMKEGIFDNLLNRMVGRGPCPYKAIIA